MVRFENKLWAQFCEECARQGYLYIWGKAQGGKTTLMSGIPEHLAKEILAKIRRVPVLFHLDSN